MLDYRRSQWPPLVLSMPPFWIYIPCFHGKSVRPNVPTINHAMILDPQESIMIL
jgi:hypothetical protein